MRSPRTSTRLCAALASLALVGAGVASLAHQVEARHEICAEHGERIHVGANAGVIAEVTSGAISNNPLGLDHGDHCAIAWSTTEVVTPVAGVAASAFAVAPESSSAPVDRPAVTALWRLAPKTSPPV